MLIFQLILCQHLTLPSLSPTMPTFNGCSYYAYFQRLLLLCLLSMVALYFMFDECCIYLNLKLLHFVFYVVVVVTSDALGTPDFKMVCPSSSPPPFNFLLPLQHYLVKYFHCFLWIVNWCFFHVFLVTFCLLFQSFFVFLAVLRYRMCVFIGVLSFWMCVFIGILCSWMCVFIGILYVFMFVDVCFYWRFMLSDLCFRLFYVFLCFIVCVLVYSHL